MNENLRVRDGVWLRKLRFSLAFLAVLTTMGMLYFPGGAGAYAASADSLPAAFRADATADEISAGFITDAFDVDVVVQKDNSFLVTETIAVDFLESSHGLMRNIPTSGEVISSYKGEMVRMDGRMKIQDVDVQGYDFATYSENGDFVIRIGSADFTVEGPHTYRIVYRARLYDDNIDAYDMVYLNVLPTGWATPIRSSALRITIPGVDTDVSGAELIAGYAAKTKATIIFGHDKRQFATLDTAPDYYD